MAPPQLVHSLEPAAAAALPASATGAGAPARPVARSLRFLKAYWVTFVVVASYVSARLQARVRSPAALERLLERKHLANARRIERTILRLQGLFIKVGQLISIMTNFLPAHFREELEGLQDQVPPRPFGDIERRFREEFAGRGPREVFAEFAETPIASASIGQVHVARTLDGRKVAVKVQYPDIEEIVRIDLRTLRRIFRVIGRFMPTYGLETVYREIREMILQELDFRAEADNVDRIAANFRGRADVGFPVVLRELSTARILTTEWVDGIKINDVARIDGAGIDRRQLARRVVTAYCKQIFSDGVYHADPHPGNLLVQPGEIPRVVFLDFGAVAQISDRMRRGIVEFLQAAINRDTGRIVSAMKQMGFISKLADPTVFDRVVEYFHQRFQEEVRLESFSLKDVKFDPEKGLENLADLRRMDVSLRDITDNFHVPKEWIMLERTVLLLMGLCTELDREMNPMTVIRPYLTEFVLGKDQDWSRFVVDTTRDLALSAASLPGELRRFMATAQRGDLSVRFRNLDDNVRLLYTLGHQLIYTALGISAGLAALVLSGRGADREATWALWAAGAAALLLVGSIGATRARLRRRRR